MNLTPVLALLQERTGLAPGSLGERAVEAAVRRRLRQTGLDLPGYAERLSGDGGELAALAGELVVPETWFFRGGGVFSYLAAQARAVATARAEPFRALSLPCSTGEEPYSLAIALDEAGVPEERVVIDAVDLSARHVEAARRGVYSDLAFRQTPEGVREHHFRPAGRNWEIDPGLRSRVRFRVGNLLDPWLLRGEKPYDLVFCRNLFIYLTPAARRQGMAALARLVAPGGLLCMGHAEPLDPADGRFVGTGPEGFFLYRRAEEHSRRVGYQPVPRPAEKAAPLPDRRHAAAPATAPPPAQGQAGSLSHDLRRAREEADDGRYDRALALCQEAEAKHGPSADLYTLLGILHHARRDDAEAGRCFTKALYLDPQHREALMHLMLLAQLQGADGRAAALRRRLERLAPEEQI